MFLFGKQSVLLIEAAMEYDCKQEIMKLYFFWVVKEKEKYIKDKLNFPFFLLLFGMKFNIFSSFHRSKSLIKYHQKVEHEN